MTLTRTTRRSGLLLVALALLGAALFWLTDPQYGPPVGRTTGAWHDPHYWLVLVRGAPDNWVDAAHQSYDGTAAGLAGCGLVLLIGLYLMTRRRV